MKGLETGHDKVKRICDLLKKETLEPARLEAEKIIEKGRKEAEALLQEARRVSAQVRQEAEAQSLRHKEMVEASLSQACRQTVEYLKQKIEKQFFDVELSRLLTKPLQDEKLMAKLIEALIQAIEKGGIDSDVTAFVSMAIKPDEVNGLLAKKMLERLKEKSVVLSSMGGGVQLKVEDQNMIIDLSLEAVQEMVAGYLRKSFREFIFRK